MSFEFLMPHKNLIDALKKQQITIPTQIQLESYSHICSGNDFIGESYTGTGKTLAYLLPLFTKIIENNILGNYGIVLTPTHELAIQVHKQVELLAKNSSSDIHSTVIMGNVNITRQIEALKSKPQIIIGTAGRIYELIKKKKIAAHLVKYLVVDEADKLLDNNNLDSTISVRKCLMKDAQVVIFSASISDKTMKSTINILCEPKEIRIKNSQKSPDTIEHMYVIALQREKIEMLRRLLHSLHAKKALVFINKVYDIELATQKLKYHNFSADCIHGENDKLKRKKLLESFKNGKLSTLVATDLAARGLQIDGIDIVVSYSIPESSSEYLHRAGRTGRNGNKGKSILIVTEKEIPLIKKYNKELGINIKEMRLYKGKLVDSNINEPKKDTKNKVNKSKKTTIS